LKDFVIIIDNTIIIIVNNLIFPLSSKNVNTDYYNTYITHDYTQMRVVRGAQWALGWKFVLIFLDGIIHNIFPVIN